VELDTLEKLYIDGLKDLWSAENMIVKALPKMTRAASSRPLKQAFRRHLAESREHVRRLNRITRALGVSPRGKHCVGMEGLIKEGAELIRERPDPDVLDAGLITAAQHVEHYEMAGYGTVRTWARLLGYGEHANILQRTLNEEGDTDKGLTKLAKRINVEAKSPED
jgi:ferritin-like metal-binding protein YciE